MVFLPINTLLLALAAPLANQGVATNHFNLAARTTQSLGNGVPLRIMPLGASITYGWGSSDGNGYRQDLRSALVSGSGNPVNMVGSRQHGSMPDSDVEGWPGYRIEQVQAKALAPGSVPHYKPNVVLLNAGTNDALQGWNVSTAGQRAEQLIRALFVASPRAVVVLSTLIVNKKVDASVQVINQQFVDVAMRLSFEGKRVVLVDMHDDAGPTMDDLSDVTHPNDVGYMKMANIWLGGLLAASDAGWLQAPEAVDGVPDNGA